MIICPCTLVARLNTSVHNNFLTIFVCRLLYIHVITISAIHYKTELCFRMGQTENLRPSQQWHDKESNCCIPTKHFIMLIHPDEMILFILFKLFNLNDYLCGS